MFGSHSGNQDLMNYKLETKILPSINKAFPSLLL